MVPRLLRIQHLAWRQLTGGAHSPAVAAGVAFGVAIGLLPKTNILVAIWLLLLFVSRAHLVAALIAALMFHGVGLLLDPVWHVVGHFVLTMPLLQGLLAELYELPGVPWTEFNNTVACGAFLAGLLQFYPAYLGMVVLLQRFQGGPSAESTARPAEEVGLPRWSPARQT